MEILAPAGSIAALKAAIKGGADAVYLGLGEHNARIKSNDFNEDNLSDWVSYAHLFGVKVHVTLNTAVKQEEMPRVLALARVAVNAGADALIVSDLGMVKLLSDLTNIPLHLSTQAGVQNAMDVEALKGLRIKRVILAREALLQDVAEIKKKVAEAEIFAQGAVCVSFSGGCLLGSKVYDASGNRGLCNQACRLTYTALDEDGREITKGKLLSARDLSLGEKVLSPECNVVDSIKIEGRLKRPLYVYAATKYYRDLLDGKDVKQDLVDLEESFNRGFTKGYTLCKSDKVINVQTASHIGIPVGKILSIKERGGYKYACVSSNYPFEKGDGAKILRKGVEVGGSDVTSVRLENGLYLIPVSDGVKIGDQVCLTTCQRKVAESERIVNKLPIRLVLTGEADKRITLRAEYGSIIVEVVSESVAQKGNGKDNAALVEKLSKVGSSDFEVQCFSDMSKQPLYLNASELNNMRRSLLVKLREKIVQTNTPNYYFDDPRVCCKDERKVCVPKKIAEVSTTEEIATCAFADAFVLTPAKMEVDLLHAMLRSAGEKKCYLRLPKIVRGKELSFFKDLLCSLDVGVYADNLYAVAFARQYNKPYIAGFGLNVFNSVTASLFTDADHVCASVEYPFYGDLIYRAGKMPLMSFAHCPVSVVYPRECGSCKQEKDTIYYQNGNNRYKMLRRRSASCDFTLYEDKITYYPILEKRSCFYSLIGLTGSEKKEVITCISEEIGE